MLKSHVCVGQFLQQRKTANIFQYVYYVKKQQQKKSFYGPVQVYQFCAQNKVPQFPFSQESPVKSQPPVFI